MSRTHRKHLPQPKPRKRGSLKSRKQVRANERTNLRKEYR